MVIALLGDLGSGKTTFARFFIESILLDKTQKITSPTFNIIHTYDTKKGPVWHIDLYRITDPSEVPELGLLEAMEDSICLIEWPEILLTHTTPKTLIAVDLSA
jgi:tRNA threonylcarbamoyl adenosine modification protein YjeE